MSVEEERNRNARKLKHTSTMHRNCIRIHPQNSDAHERKKVDICRRLLEEGREFVTEAEFKDTNIRADIFVLDDGTIYEIESTDQNLEERKEKYPDDIEVIPLWEES